MADYAEQLDRLRLIAEDPDAFCGVEGSISDDTHSAIKAVLARHDRMEAELRSIESLAGWYANAHDTANVAVGIAKEALKAIP